MKSRTPNDTTGDDGAVHRGSNVRNLLGMGTSRLMTRGRTRPPCHAAASLAVTLSVTLLASSCGTSTASETTTTPPPTVTTAPAPTTTAPRVSTVAVEPASGGRNTVFTLTGHDLPPGMTVKFDIVYPGASKTFSGQRRQVPADGTLQVTYRSSASNPLGEYTVRIVGTEGKIAETKFRVSPGHTTSPGQVTDGGGSGSEGSGSGTSTTKAKSTSTTAKSHTTDTTKKD